MSIYKKDELIEIRNKRLGEERYNSQGCLMKIIEYNSSHDIIVEFQDEYKTRIHTNYGNFKKREIKNPYFKLIYGVAAFGCKYPSKIGKRTAKEYQAWKGMLDRCFNEKTKEKNPTYKDVACCEEWLLYENFYEWLHEQENFDKWLNGRLYAIDKDILVKRNKIYSPETCCLVPVNINRLFARINADIEIRKNERYRVRCTHKNLGTFCSKEEAFQAYKQYKENLIKQVAQEEYEKGNITKRCYEAMMNYEVEITD